GELGETGELVAATAEGRDRAQAKAAEPGGRVKGKTAQVRAKAAERGPDVRSQVAGKTAMGRQKATAAGSAAKAQLQARAAPAWQAAPEPVRRTVSKGASSVSQRRVPLAVAAVTLI